MQKETRITFIILAISGLLILGNIVVNTPWVKDYFDGNKIFISPLSNSINIFSFFKKREVPQKTIYGYLPYWMLEKSDNIQLDKLTDIAYFGLYLQKDGTFLKINELGETDPGYNNWHNNKKLEDLIKRSKEFGVRVSLTVISHDDDISDQFLSCRNCWDKFLSELTTELNFRHIRDVNLNFEYAGYVEDDTMRDKFTEFTKFLHENLHRKYGDSLLVVSTFADAVVKPRITKVEDIAKVSDAIFIMGYDFHRPQSDTTGPVAPIDGKGTKTEYDIKTSIQDYISVVPPNKIILGVPYYGYNWVIGVDEPYAKVIKNEAETPSPSPDLAANQSIPNVAVFPEMPINDNSLDDGNSSISQTYDDVMNVVQKVKPVIKWDDIAKSPFFTYKSPDTGLLRQVYYENSESLRAKYNLIKENNLAGVGIWALGYDGGFQEFWVLLKDFFLK